MCDACEAAICCFIGICNIFKLDMFDAVVPAYWYRFFGSDMFSAQLSRRLIGELIVY